MRSGSAKINGIARRSQYCPARLLSVEQWRMEMPTSRPCGAHPNRCPKAQITRSFDRFGAGSVALENDRFE